MGEIVNGEMRFNEIGKIVDETWRWFYKSNPANTPARKCGNGIFIVRARVQHIIRNDDEYQHIAEYIINNPKKWDRERMYPKNNQALFQ